MARLAIFCTSEGLISRDLTHLARMGKPASMGSSFSHSIPFTPWNSSSKLVALNWPITSMILSQVRSQRLARKASSKEPSNSAPPTSSTRTLSMPRCFRSRPVIPSMPNAALAIHFMSKTSPSMVIQYDSTVYYK